MSKNRSFLESLSSDATADTLRGVIAALDSAGVAAVIFDPDDKLLLCTEAHLSMNEHIRSRLVPGVTFGEICRCALEQLSLDAKAQEKWLAAKFRRFKDPPVKSEEHHSNGRWYSLQDVRTPEGYYIGIRRDITDQRDAVGQRDELEQRFLRLAELTSDFFWEMDADLRFTKFSGSGSDKAYVDAIGKQRWETATEQDLRDWRKWVFHRAALEARQPFHEFEFEIQTDPPIWARVSGEPVFDENNSFTGYIGTTTNITQQKHDELRLRESEDRYRTLVEGSVQGVVVHAGDRALYVNQAVASMLGYSVEELYALEDLSVLFTDESRLTHQHYRDSRLSGDEVPNEYETDWIRKDGQVITIQQFSQSVNWDGQPAIQATMVDVTEKKRAQATIVEREHRTRLIADSLPLTVVYVDCERRYRFVNDAYLAWYGQSADNIWGGTWKTSWEARPTSWSAQGSMRRSRAGSRISKLKYPLSLPAGSWSR